MAESADEEAKEMNLYEHLETVERASGLSKKEIMELPDWESLRLAERLIDNHDALVSFNVVRSFKDSAKPCDTPADAGKRRSIYCL